MRAEQEGTSGEQTNGAQAGGERGSGALIEGLINGAWAFFGCCPSVAGDERDAIRRSCCHEIIDREEDDKNEGRITGEFNCGLDI